MCLTWKASIDYGSVDSLYVYLWTVIDAVKTVLIEYTAVQLGDIAEVHSAVVDVAARLEQVILWRVDSQAVTSGGDQLNEQYEHDISWAFQRDINIVTGVVIHQLMIRCSNEFWNINYIQHIDRVTKYSLTSLWLCRQCSARDRDRDYTWNNTDL